MSWLRLDDGFTQHPKVVKLTRPDRWTWLEVLCYCARYKTRGVVPAAIGEVVRGATPAYLSRCYELDLLDLAQDGEDYLVHDWDDYNGRDPKVLQAERQRKHRDSAVTEPLQERDENVTHAQVRARVPVPSPSVEQSSTAQALVAEYVDATRELGVNPPSRLVGQVAQQVGQLLSEGQEVGTLSAALRLMIDKRLHPSTLPSLLLEAKAGPAARRQDERKPRHEPPVEEALNLPELTEDEIAANKARLKAMTA